VVFLPASRDDFLQCSPSTFAQFLFSGFSFPPTTSLFAYAQRECTELGLAQLLFLMLAAVLVVLEAPQSMLASNHSDPPAVRQLGWLLDQMSSSRCARSIGSKQSPWSLTEVSMKERS
jgi:hypothetical protein